MCADGIIGALAVALGQSLTVGASRTVDLGCPRPRRGPCSSARATRRGPPDAPSAPKSVTGCASDSTPGWPVPAVPDPAERPLSAGHRQGGRGEPGAGGPRPCRSRRTAGAAVSGAPARPAGHRPLNIRSGRRHGSPPVSRSQAARAATGPLMRTFPGQLRTAPPGCFAGGGAGGGAGFRSSPPATSERDHSTR